MKKYLLLLLLTTPAFGQFSSISRRLLAGTADPATCFAGPPYADVFVNTSTGALKFCSATNTWIALSTGTISAGTTNQIPKYTAATALGNSNLDDGATTANTLTYTGSAGGSFTKIATTAANGGFDGTEGTGASLTAATSHDLFYPDSTAHRWKMNNNNAGAVSVVGISTAATSGNCAKFAANGIDVVDQGAACGTSGIGLVMALMNPGSFAAPADSTTYYAGQGGVASTTYNNVRYYVQKACTVKAVTYTTVAGGTVQSNESYNQDIFQNGTTQVTGTSAAFAAATATVQNQVTGLSYALAAGDYIALRIITPAWATNPTSTFWRADVYCE